MPSQITTLAYKPTVLRENSDWYIEYSYRTSTGSMMRVRNKLNSVLKRFRTESEKRSYALTELSRINSKLAQGWTPDYDKALAINSFAATNWSDVVSSYEEYLIRSEKTGELSHSTRLSYHSTFTENQQVLGYLKENLVSLQILHKIYSI